MHVGDSESHKRRSLLKFLKRREGEFSSPVPLSVFAGTWNVNGKKPYESLLPWLNSGFEEDERPDIYAVGFQELDLTSGALLLGDTSRALLWEKQIVEELNSTGTKYVRVQTKQLVGILLVILVQEKHLSHVGSFRNSYAACGLMGMMGNKGGVGVRFQIYDSTICFVNSHLSAHTENVQRRNQDFADICRRLVFPTDRGDGERTMFQHDFLIWLGDLNYRLNLEDHVVRQKVIDGAYEELLQYDQLYEQQKMELAFSRFHEAPINFAPTYKYDPGTNIYDTGEKRRAPAWCDRVLWLGACNLKVKRYFRSELMTSDHKPVSAIFELNAKQIDQERRREIAMDITKQLDRKENESIPQCELSARMLDVGDVHYMQSVTRSVVLRNTSISTDTSDLVNFYFVPKPHSGSQEIGKSWLTVSPEGGSLAPGESVSLSITVYVESEAAALNLGRDKLSDILIIRLENGPDHYLEVTGNYIRTCLGNYIDYLVRQPAPIRDNEEPLPADSPHVLSIPKELWLLVDAISKHPNKDDLFRDDGNLDEVQQIMEKLDRGEPVPSGPSIYSVGESLLRFLSSLAEPVIPFTMYQRFLDAPGYTEYKQLLSSLKTAHYNVFYYLMAFLRDVVLTPTADSERVDSIALIFGDVILRAPHGEQQPANSNKAAHFVQCFLKRETLTVP